MPLSNKTKQLVQLLFQDHYLRPRKNHAGKLMYVVYTGKQNPVLQVKPEVVKPVSSFMKKQGNVLTLNRNLIRQAHGNSSIKRMYKNHSSQLKETTMQKSSNKNAIRLLKNEHGEFWWNKKAGNGAIISRASETYSSKPMALQGLVNDTLITLRALNIVFPNSMKLHYYDNTLAKPKAQTLSVENSIINDKTC